MNSSFNILEYSYYSWSLFASIILSTSNRLYIGWFGILMFLLLGLSIVAYSLAFIIGTSVDIDGIREPVSGSLLYGNNIVTAAVILSSNAIGVHFYSLWRMNGYIMVVLINLLYFILYLVYLLGWEESGSLVLDWA